MSTNGLRGRRFQAAIVDLDGTMVDTAGDFVVALRLALADLGYPAVSRDFVLRTIGKGSEHLISCALAEVGAPPKLQPQMWQRYQHHYLAINGQHAQVFGGVIQGLQGLQALGLKLACLTNKPMAFAQPLLQQKDLTRYFAHCFGGDSFERKKPDPLPLLKTCQALGTDPADTLMIGDSSNDAAAARAAGMAVVLVRHGYNHGQPIEAAGADLLVDGLHQVPGLLQAS